MEEKSARRQKRRWEMLDLKLITQAPKAGMRSCVLGPATPGRPQSEELSKQWQ